MRWKIEAKLQEILPKSIYRILYPYKPVFTYRSILHGNWNNDYWPKFNTKNPIINNQREPDCHATLEEFNLAKKYMNRLKSGDVVLTLMPYNKSCRPRVNEIAHYLKTPFISIAPKGMTYFDGGGHLDKAGAKKATLQFLSQLEKLPSFKKLIAERSHEGHQ